MLVKGVPHGPMKIYDREGRIVIAAKFYAGRLDDDHVVGWKNNLRIEEKLKSTALRTTRGVGTPTSITIATLPAKRIAAASGAIVTW